MNAPWIARRCFISGRVQGVYYRASARNEARSLDVVGHARNLPDGRVEVLAVGTGDAVQRLLDWLRHGPPAARVDAVEVVELEIENFPDEFSVG